MYSWAKQRKLGQNRGKLTYSSRSVSNAAGKQESSFLPWLGNARSGGFFLTTTKKKENRALLGGKKKEVKSPGIVPRMLSLEFNKTAAKEHANAHLKTLEEARYLHVDGQLPSL